MTLDRPIEGVTPVTLGGEPTELATILGKGMTARRLGVFGCAAPTFGP